MDRSFTIYNICKCFGFCFHACIGLYSCYYRTKMILDDSFTTFKYKATVIGLRDRFHQLIPLAIKMIDVQFLQRRCSVYQFVLADVHDVYQK